MSTSPADQFGNKGESGLGLPGNFHDLQMRAESWTPDQLLRWAADEFGDGMEIASAFGAEGIVLIDLAARVIQDIKVFILDTGFLFPETLELMAQVERRYGIKIERVRPETSVEGQNQQFGPALWTRDPDLCCSLRKVQPLEQKLANLRAWATAIRRDQTAARRNVRKIEWDPNFRIVKLNPLADWTHSMIWSYIGQHRLVYNPLHDQNYPSIGCTHCTRPVRSGEDQRAGRWPGFAKKECGLHVGKPTDGKPSIPCNVDLSVTGQDSGN